MDVLASFSGKTVNASAIGRKLLVSHTTASEWIRDLGRLNLLWLVPCQTPGRRPLLVVRDSLEGRLLKALQAVPSVGHVLWRRWGTRPVVLVADFPTERVGFCWATSVVLRRADWLPLVLARRRGVIHRGILLHTDAGATIKEGVVALPSSAFLEEPEAWIRRTADQAGRFNAVWRFNRERLARWRAHR